MQGYAGKKDGVLVNPIDTIHDLGLVPPDANGVALDRKQIGQGRAPAAGSEDSHECHERGVLAGRCPRPRAVGWNRRSMHRRCSSSTQAATKTVTDSSSGFLE